MARVKYINRIQAAIYNLGKYPNFHVSGSVTGMRKRVYGKNALIVRHGSYYYVVPAHIYEVAK